MLNSKIKILESDLTIGEKVRVARVMRKWRQADLAQLSRTSQWSISKFETNKPISEEAMTRVLAAVGLMEGEE